jgi:hypothetical protein
LIQSGVAGVIRGMTIAEEIERNETDAEQVIRATIDTSDQLGALCLDVAVWTCNYGPYLRYVLHVDRANRGSRSHPFSRLEDDDGDDCVQVGNVVADNEATRAILRLIALPDPELTRVAGNSGGPGNYRALLIRCLAHLWD